MAIETVPIQRAQWTDLVLRMDIPAGRKAVAFALAKFANPDGTRVFPGQGKVADMARLHESNAHKHIQALLAVGMLIVVKRGGGRGGATNTYRLTRPADITTLPLWLDPEMNRIGDVDGGGEKHPSLALDENESDDQEQQAPAMGETPEQTALALGVSVDNSAETPVDNPETPIAGAVHSDHPDRETPIVLTRNTHRWRYPTYPRPIQYQPNTTLGQLRRPRHLRSSPRSATTTRRRRIPSHPSRRRPMPSSTLPAPSSPRCAARSPTAGATPPGPSSKPPAPR